MNMKRRIVLLLSVALGFIGCAEPSDRDPEESAIRLSGRVAGAAAHLPVTIGADYTGALPVAFARVDGDASYSQVNAALAATRLGGADATEISFTEPQYYQRLAKENETRLVGWYPAVTPEEGVLSFDISQGTTDVLLTQELAGTAGRPFCMGDTSFVFSHQLCRIVVSVTVSSRETVALWGSISSVTIKDLPTSYQIVLPCTAAGVSGSTDVVLKQRGGTFPMSPVALERGRYLECGYLLTLPQTASLTVDLQGSSGMRRVIEAPLPAGEVFRPGFAYELHLNLDAAQRVGGTLNASGWADEVNLDVEF